jgi:hypothetical protein
MMPPTEKDIYQALVSGDPQKLYLLCKDSGLSTYKPIPKDKNRLEGAMADGVSTELLEMMVKLGVDPNGVAPTRNGPLIEAIRSKKIEYVKFMLDQKIDLSNYMDKGRCVLSAVHYEIPVPMQIEILKILVAHGVDINFQYTIFGDKTKLFTVLDHATAPETKEYLRSIGAKTNAELKGQGPTARKTGLLSWFSRKWNFR